MESKECKEICKSLNPCPSVKKIGLENDAHLKKYIIWENKSNICWLDASMALVAHNKVMKRYSGVSPECVISKIISIYDEAITILNSSDKNINPKLILARGKLNDVQESTLQYLKPILKYKIGDPESAFCSLYNLLIQDSVMKRIFDVTWISVKECTDCGNKYSCGEKCKPIITLSEIDSFDPENPAVVHNGVCNKCLQSKQKLKFVYVSLPPCLIFHFEKGAGKEKAPLSFITREREYHLTGIMTLEKSQDSTVNHFITWVRNPTVNKWLDCNDLNLDTISFSPDFPDINFKDVYMYVYESFDDLGTITDSEIVKTKKSEENIPCIDLSEESDAENSNSQSASTEANKDTSKMEILKTDLKSSIDNVKIPELDKDKSIKKSFSTNNKNILDRNISHGNITQNLKSTSNNLVRVNMDKKEIEPIEAGKDKVLNENTKNHDSDILKTVNVILDDNMTSTNEDDTKEMNENICKSDCNEDNVKFTEVIGRNKGSFLSRKETLKVSRVSSVTENRHEKLELKCKTSSVETKSSFYNDKKQNFSMNTTKNIRNKELSSKKVCSNTLNRKLINRKCIGSKKNRNLIQIKHSGKTDIKKEDMSSSEELLSSSDKSFDKCDAGQSNNERLVFNSNIEQGIHGGLFLTDAAANSCGTSYVKLSVRRKKYSSHPLHQENFGSDVDNLDTGEILHNMTTNSPSSSKSLKRGRVKKEIDEGTDYVPNKMPKQEKRLKKLSNVKRVTFTPEEKGHHSKALITELKEKSQVKSKLNHIAGNRIIHDNNSGLQAINEEHFLNNHQKLLSEQGCFQSGAVSKTDNSNMNSDNEGKILKDFEDVWSCHKSGCDCDCADIEETIDVVVDYTFAYICKLSQEFKKPITQSNVYF